MPSFASSESEGRQIQELSRTENSLGCSDKKKKGIHPQIGDFMQKDTAEKKKRTISGSIIHSL